MSYVEAVNEFVRPIWAKVNKLAEEHGMNAEFEVYRTPARYMVRYKMPPIINEVKLTYRLSELLWGAISSLIYMLSKIIGFPPPNMLWGMDWNDEFCLALPGLVVKMRADVNGSKLYCQIFAFNSERHETYTTEEFAEFLVNSFLLLKQANKEGISDA
jgi:head-tail adaptor